MDYLSQVGTENDTNKMFRVGYHFTACLFEVRYILGGWLTMVGKTITGGRTFLDCSICTDFEPVLSKPARRLRHV